MTERSPAAQGAIDARDEELVLSTLERGQLADARSRRLPRRRLKGREILVLASLRLYLLFMIAVVLYQLWTGAR